MKTWVYITYAEWLKAARCLGLNCEPFSKESIAEYVAMIEDWREFCLTNGRKARSVE